MAKDKTNQKDINLLFELGNIRFIERMWRRFLGHDFQNLAEHHFRVFWIAMVIASHEEGVDTGKIAKMALLHDIAESRTGDVDYLSRQYVERREEMAIKDMLGGSSLEDEFIELWREYEKRESLESRIVKDADNLDCDFELADQKSKGSSIINKDTRDFVAENKLYTTTAKQMYKQVYKTDPHIWHRQGRNRRSSGDWST